MNPFGPAVLALALAPGAAAAPDVASEPTAPHASGAEISFDFDAAEAALAALEGSPTMDAAAAARLPGNVRMVEHQHRFDPGATPERLVESLRQAAAGVEIEPDTFLLEHRTKTRLAATRSMLARIKANPSKLADEIRARIARYTPPDLKFPVQVDFIVGGTSDGFADDAVFCVAVDYFGDDDAGLRTMMAHELFHVAYDAAVKAAGEVKKPPPLSKNAERLLPLFEDTMNEGVASRVGDPMGVTDGKAWVEWFQGKFRKNFERLDSSFVLFDTILYREDHDPTAPIDALYRIGFSGSFDSALYFVGYEMARVLEKDGGPEAVARCISEGPLAFFAKYIAISHAHPDRVPHRFDEETERIVRKLSAPAKAK